MKSKNDEDSNFFFGNEFGKNLKALESTKVSASGIHKGSSKWPVLQRIPLELPLVLRKYMYMVER